MHVKIHRVSDLPSPDSSIIDMNHTPWTKKTSSFPSDRIRPKAPTDTKANVKATGKRRQDEPTKSKEVRKLESLLKALQEPAEVGKRAEKDPNGGCFCLGIYQFGSIDQACQAQANLINSANT